jgi:hypothetical protein
MAIARRRGSRHAGAGENEGKNSEEKTEMTKAQQAAIDSAREHAQAAAAHLKRARNAHANGDDAAVQRCHRAAAASLGELDRALDAIGSSLAESNDSDGHDPIANPSAAQGAQVSSGRAPRSFDPETRRQQDQLESCRIAHRERMRQMNVVRR